MLWCSDNNNRTIGRQSHGLTEVVIHCFTNNIGSKLYKAMNGGIIFVDTDITRNKITAIIVLRPHSQIFGRTDHNGGTIRGYLHHMTEIIKGGGTVEIRSHLYILIDGSIVMVDTNKTGTIGAIRCTHHNGGTIFRYSHGRTETLTTIFAIYT